MFLIPSPQKHQTKYTQWQHYSVTVAYFLHVIITLYSLHSNSVSVITVLMQYIIIQVVSNYVMLDYYIIHIQYFSYSCRVFIHTHAINSITVIVKFRCQAMGNYTYKTLKHTSLIIFIVYNSVYAVYIYQPLGIHTCRQLYMCKKQYESYNFRKQPLYSILTLSTLL